MKTTFWLIFTGFILQISGENSTESKLATNGTENRLDFLQEKLADALERLTAAVKSNEKQIGDLRAGMVANFSRLSDEINNLESSVNDTRKLTEEKIEDLKTNIGGVNSGKILKRIAALESTMSKNHKSTEEVIKRINFNISELANQTSKILDLQVIPSCKTPSTSGTYKLQFPNMNVLCEAHSFDGGWIVIQQRVDMTLDFNRNWTEYRNGFGTLGETEEFWLGNEALHRITSSSGDFELAIELRNDKNEPEFARYSTFRVSGEDDRYRLQVTGHSGGSLVDKFWESNSKQFSTYDNDSDGKVFFCPKRNRAGWWYPYGCGSSILNKANGPYWHPWTGTYSRMMIRRK